MKRILLLFTFLICYSIYGQSVKNVSRDWTSFVQSIEVKADKEKKFRVVAYAKVETTDEKGRAGIWARVDNKPNEGRGFFDNMRNRPIVSKKWTSYTVEGVINSKSEILNFGVICYNNGKFYFDKFEVFIEDDNGEFQPVKISNPSFEERVKNNVIPSWDAGIGRKRITNVREFSFTNNAEAVDGTYSILVEGSGINKNTGDSGALIPNAGTYISLLYILLFALTLITYLRSNKNNKWSKLGDFGFKFSFVYFFLFIIFKNNGAYPFWGYVIEYPAKLVRQFIPWVGKNVLQLPFDINTGPNGSGDTTYGYVLMFVIFIIAFLSAIVWSLLSRKQKNNDKLYYWLTTAIRYYVGLMLINYGMVKVIQLQFSQPSFYRLMQPYGESSPMGLAWTFLGFSKGYNLFMGIAEVLAGLLLFRRTLTFGAVITLMTTMNVMAVNYFYDVPVKILSTHLVLMTLFLLFRDLKKVMEYLVTNNPVEKLTVIKQPELKKWFSITLKVLKVLIVFYALGYGFYDTLEMKKKYGRGDQPKPELYGVYKVTNYVINNDTITNYKNNKLWKRIMFEREGAVLIETMNEKRIFYKVAIDSVTKKMKFSSSNGNASGAFDFNYTKTDTSLDFNFISGKDTISGKSKIMNDKSLLLVNRGFHWINESPYNR